LCLLHSIISYSNHKYINFRTFYILHFHFTLELSFLRLHITFYFGQCFIPASLRVYLLCLIPFFLSFSYCSLLSHFNFVYHHHFFVHLVSSYVHHPLVLPYFRGQHCFADFLLIRLSFWGINFFHCLHFRLFDYHFKDFQNRCLTLSY